ncbi:hypothetical protein nbrc107696_25310 [Gordonia spumicola]|uniref:GIY-YIG domain-containing protein n=2 Tax=Gordonia spumicola TaxID=589161 RepID=A0A7I9V9U1_9ACTN|nr:hypothetical protein nbrc107696_25310 [Gordonia spumicola]
MDVPVDNVLVRSEMSVDAVGMAGYLYMLECADGSFYVGSTRNMFERLRQHRAGKGAAYTSRRLPVRLVYVAEFPTVDEAFAREKQVQGWGRAKRIALARGDFDLLHALSTRGRRVSDDDPDDATFPSITLFDD